MTPQPLPPLLSMLVTGLGIISKDNIHTRDAVVKLARVEWDEFLVEQCGETTRCASRLGKLNCENTRKDAEMHLPKAKAGSNPASTTTLTSVDHEPIGQRGESLKADEMEDANRPSLQGGEPLSLARGTNPSAASIHLTVPSTSKGFIPPCKAIEGQRRDAGDTSRLIDGCSELENFLPGEDAEIN